MRSGYKVAADGQVKPEASVQQTPDYPSIVKELRELPNGQDKAILLLKLFTFMQKDGLGLFNLYTIAPFPELQNSLQGSQPLVDLGTDAASGLSYYPNANASAIEASTLKNIACQAWRESTDLIHQCEMSSVFARKYAPKPVCSPTGD